MQSPEITNDTEATRAAGAAFAATLSVGSVVALHGPLGAGKTTFVQGMARGLGLNEQVTSPTFGLVQEYGRPPKLIHIDCYRESNLMRWQALGLQEYFDLDVITVIEWAEIIAPLLPPGTVNIAFEHGPDETQRRFELMK
ncbi:tRNA (adenosine(37)-N6)-threonylcarbamoyltransferase complex ATPase subunit type 1 TsaE [Candidatus Neomarinimicrobiota bacterium]